MPNPSAKCRPVFPGSPQPQSQGLWAQRSLGITDAWTLTHGEGVTVAVVDTGIDYTPLLAGRVTATSLTGTGLGDCAGHGTAVASLIAGADLRAQGIPLTGVAPGARVLSVKVTDGEKYPAPLVAEGVQDAAASGARVINVSSASSRNPALCAAAADAIRHNAVVVAAAGNDETKGPNATGPFYPASCPGVLSVGAVASNGAPASFTDPHTPVSVVAPGANIASGWPGGYGLQNGTSFAAAFASGVAALVRAAHPELSAPQVVDRIEATADGRTSPLTGHGMINPVQAVTAVLPPQGQGSSPGPAARAVSLPQTQKPDPLARNLAASVAVGSLGLAAVVIACAVIIPHGRRRRWRPGTVVPAGTTMAVGDDDEAPWPGGR